MKIHFAAVAGLSLLSAVGASFAADSSQSQYGRVNPGDWAVFYCQDQADRKMVPFADRPAFLRQCLDEQARMGGSTRPEKGLERKTEPELRLPDSEATR